MAKVRKKWFGPGFLVTAAFVGPGTIATASRAGSGFGYALLWAVVFSVLATIILQEMTVRLGAMTGSGLGESLRTTFSHAAARWFVFTLVIAAILFGNTAYQAGNITGAAKGLSDVSGYAFQYWVIPIAAAAWVLLMTGRFQLVQRVLIVLVCLMSALFVLSAIVINPPWGEVIAGIVIPSFPSDSLGLVIALVGTTVVPYNLFLHSNSVATLWRDEPDREMALWRSRVDAVVSISVGGLITSAIVISAAVALGGQAEKGELGAIAQQLEPVLGPASPWIFGLGLFAAGLTSAITAPLAAAYATTGCLGWETRLAGFRFRLVFSVVLLGGMAACLVFQSGRSPQEMIVLAQLANGLLLPVITCVLLIVMNNKQLLGRHVNRTVANAFGILIVLLTAAWGVNKVIDAVRDALALMGEN